MNLKEYLEKKLNCEFINKGRVLSDSEVMNLCSYYDLYYYSQEDLKKEFISQGFDEVLLEFADIPAFAEFMNYTKINNDLFIDNLQFDLFKKNLEDYFNNDISFLIDDYYKDL